MEVVDVWRKKKPERIEREMERERQREETNEDTFATTNLWKAKISLGRGGTTAT